MAKSKAKAYLGLEWIISVILAIIPVTNIVLGFLTRFQRNNLLMAILNILLAPIFYIIDLISIVLNDDLIYFT